MIKHPTMTISFSRRNLEVYKLLQEEKHKENFNRNDFVCDAIKFYIKNKDKCNSSIDFNYINKLIDEKLLEFKSSLDIKEISLDTDIYNQELTLGNLDDD